ncbi:glycosyltransferase involved in cell wall biosynthesis [Comamonas sp. BIGb0124]|nr:glycosyltransferase involved in cell wall biosynthesis [Comamonas sp. BIGb0124]
MDVHVLVPSQQCEELTGIDRSATTTFDRPGRSLRSFFNFFISFLRSVWTLRPDVVHLHSSFAGVLGRVALLFLRPFRRPRVIYTPHAWSFIMDVSEKKKRIYSYLEKILLPLCDVVTCGSKYEKNEAEKYGIISPKIGVIYNGVLDPLVVDSLPLRSSRMELLFVGRLDQQKGFDILISAMRTLDPSLYRLTVVGGGVHDDSDHKLEDLPNVEYVGWVKQNQLPKYFAASDVLVMPSRWESFGLVAAEAHSCGLPVIASRCCSIPEIVQDGVTGFLFEKDSSSDLVDKLGLFSRETALAMRSACLLRYESLFTAKSMCERVAQTYKFSFVWK